MTPINDYCPNGRFIIAGTPADKTQAHLIFLYRPPCKSWDCPHCASSKQKRYTKTIYHGVIVGQKFWGWNSSLVTLTSHEKLTTFAACASVWPKVWKKFSTRLRREYESVEYAAVPEQHKDGRMHMHLVMSFEPKERWLKDNMRASGGGYMADVQPIEHADKAAYYVSKYIGKSLEVSAWPARFRRVRFSQGWPELPVDDAFDVYDIDWKIASKKGDLNQVVKHFESKGKRIKLMGKWGGKDYDTFKAQMSNPDDIQFPKQLTFDDI